jgi:imidazolonepropionase-like amidohydrolase
MDAHVHLAAGYSHHPGWDLARIDRSLLSTWACTSAQEAMRAGVTTLGDCGAPYGVTLQLKTLLDSGAVPGPRLLACGPCLTTTGGHAAELGVTADSGDELRRRVREVCARGADFVKIMASGGSMDPETNRRRAQYSFHELKMATEDAHRLNRKVVAHANATEAIRSCVQAGIDIVAHCNWLGAAPGTIEYDSEVASMMIKRGISIDLNIEAAITPLADYDGWMEEWVRDPVRPHTRWSLLNHLRQDGAVIYLTSDCFGPDVATFPRLLARLAKSQAVAFEEIVWRSTGVPAKSLGLGDVLGTVQPGRRADLVALDYDETVDAQCLLRVNRVFLEGRLAVQDGRLAPTVRRAPLPAVRS